MIGQHFIQTSLFEKYGELNAIRLHTSMCLMNITIPARVQLENLDPLEPLGKRVLEVSVETMGPQEDKESEDQLDHQGAQETKGTLERTDPR